MGIPENYATVNPQGVGLIIDAIKASDRAVF